MEGEYHESLSEVELIFNIICLSMAWELLGKENDCWGYVFDKLWCKIYIETT